MNILHHIVHNVSVLVWQRVLSVDGEWLLGVPAFALFYLVAATVRQIGYWVKYSDLENELESANVQIKKHYFGVRKEKIGALLKQKAELESQLKNPTSVRNIFMVSMLLVALTRTSLYFGVTQP